MAQASTDAYWKKFPAILRNKLRQATSNHSEKPLQPPDTVGEGLPRAQTFALGLAKFVTPRYGRWGGPGTDVSTAGEPIDALDREFMYHDLGYASGQRKLADRVLAERLWRGCKSGEICKLGPYAEVFAKAAQQFFMLMGRGYATPEEEAQFFETPVVRKSIPEKIPIRHAQVSHEAPTYSPTTLRPLQPTEQQMSHASRSRRSSSVGPHVRGLSVPAPRRSRSARPQLRSRSRPSFAASQPQPFRAAKAPHRKVSMKQLLKWGVSRRTAQTVKRANNPYGKSFRSGAKGARYAPVQVFPRMPGQSVQRMNNKSANSMLFEAEDRFADFTPPTGALLNAGAGVILYDQLFNPGNFPNCLRLQTLAKLYARYCVLSMSMEVITKGTTSIQGGWVAYWDAELADDPNSIPTVNAQQLLTVATNHVGATEGNWWGGRFHIPAPRKTEMLYVDVESAEQYWVYSHRFVMLSTGTSGMVASTNYATLLFRARIQFTEPTIEPLFVPNVIGTSVFGIQGANVPTINNPLGGSINSNNVISGTMQLGVSGFYLNNPALFPGICYVVTPSSSAQAIQVSVGTWMILFSVQGTGIGNVSLSVSNVTLGFNQSVTNSTSTQGTGFVSFTNTGGSNTTPPNVGLSLSAATSITGTQIRVFYVAGSLSKARHPRSRDKATRQVEFLVDRRIRELRLENQSIPLVEDLDDSKSGIVVASSDSKSELYPKPVSVVNGAVFCKHCLEDPDFRVHMHDDFGQPRLIRDNRPLFLTSVHQD